MKHRTLHEIEAEARVMPGPPSRALRRERLERLATVLEERCAPVRLLSRIEYLPRHECMRLRTDDSPLSFAYEDPVLRAQGLKSDRLGDAMAFFDLSLDEAHHLVCDCHYYGAVTSDVVASRARFIAKRVSFAELWGKVRNVLSCWW